MEAEPTTDNPRTHHHVASTPSNSGLLAASLASVSSLVFLQLFSRIFTFVLNQALVRLATPQTFGTATVQFELLLSTTLPVPRGRVHRPAAPAEERAVRPRPQHRAPAGLRRGSAVRAQQHFHLSVSIYAFAAALELAAEPLYIRAQNELRVDVRVRAEGAAVFSKTLATFLGLAFAPPAWALVAFAAGQAAYAIATVTLGDRGRKKGAYFDQELLHLSGAMTAQSVTKAAMPFASNYGSLVARVVFQPIEETSRIFFSKSLSSSPSSSSSENNQEALETAVEVLSTLLLLFTHFLLLLVVLGPPYLPLATALTSAPRILRAFRFYLPAMAYNGVLEAFLASVCTPADLRAQSGMMAAASAALIATTLAGARVFGAGDAALVWANTASMAVRALYAWRFARGFCKARAVPPPPTRDRARARARRATPAARRARSSLHALGRRCACRCPVVAVGAALARCAGRCLSLRLSRRVVRSIPVSHCSRAVRARPFADDDADAGLYLHVGAAPVPEDDRSFEEEPEVTMI
ncbi:Rft protein-domain-containing protein [Lactarius pseudohatsudake]|nr:Rft protein-domain-containing protein [Lactarius pseudohatsudake]